MKTKERENVPMAEVSSKSVPVLLGHFDIGKQHLDVL
jgi:hypothetical protein